MVPAVVIGLGLNGLGVVRSLARAGVPVIAIDDTPGNPAMRTRYGRKAWVRALEGDALVEDLVTLAQSLPEQPVLFLTGEAAVHTVSTQRAMLEPYYRMRLPAPEVVDSLMHKDTFQDLAETHGFRVPRRVHVVDDANLDGARALRYPVILKPGRRDSSYARHFKKAYRVENFEALVKLCRRIMPTLADLIVQEWIQGPDSNVYFCLQYIRADGRPAASFSGRKVRSWPPEVGGTASCTAAPEAAAELQAETARFFAMTGFVGMGSMEFKRDATTDTFYLVEPTVARTDYQEEVATLNGVNLPLAAYRAETGLGDIDFQATPRPQVWCESTTDRWSAQMQHHRCGRGPFDSGPRTDAWRRWYDPMPWLSLTNRRLVKTVRRRLQVGRLGMLKGEGA